ncbi:conjugal transfer protein TraD [Elizabethkingia meningoseptica]|uniref:conjugal transfer protein TraD n=1 Tax=Elizabethkingia meningoseptica TaxID=238 RepID=UPI0023B0AFB6|nr:conjugal transfer protein TraD [Elizabethkingia meningoseptica]MDE5437590.1 conjugal transfer protein TraD [Elizabethkingia meningoseptica]MDE5468004.1 conjugal transfer protein TraD [Elizabethkingia meningoseptica]MDE5474923.1 conjugal transfer protein TraD [Elizabethkingia meningoseptica]MDE5478356.1 conjugal transfer protein TraD [Elizabethkingia meningoseptica]MDE5486755.1 conjugal transfer protein TraD [Elizabethkingia meningoseptica]
METIIVICLLIVIALLLHDKIVYKNKKEHKAKEKKVNPNLPDIMGQPKPVRSLSMPNIANESQVVGEIINPDNLDIEYDENEEVGIQIPQEELDEVFSTTPDLKEEEEEWNRYGISSADNSLAQGVTYDELNAVGVLLQNDNLEPSQKETAIALVQKLKGTELFSILENSLEGVSLKIAELLDSTLSSETEAGSSTLRKNDLEDFDIGEFV